MYLNYYALHDNPFTLSPNPKFLYYSKTHQEAYSQFLYAITERTGYMLLTGEVGTGKTTIINAVVDTINKNYSEYLIARIFHTVLSPKGLIQNICSEFGIPYRKETMSELVFKLHEYLTYSSKSGKKAILVIDEAQNLRKEILEEIRLLSNFEAVDEKFLQIFLIGHPELDDMLRSPQLRQLHERIGLRYQLQRLSFWETNEYIRHRLAIAGMDNGKILFSEEAIQEIYTLSKGIPRRINLLCDHALLMGYARELNEIDKNVIQDIELSFDDVSKKLESYLPFSDASTRLPEKDNGKISRRKSKRAEKNPKVVDEAVLEDISFSNELNDLIKDLDQPVPTIPRFDWPKPEPLAKRDSPTKEEIAEIVKLAIRDHSASAKNERSTGKTLGFIFLAIAVQIIVLLAALFIANSLGILNSVN